MKTVKHLLVVILVVVLFSPAQGWLFSNELKKLGNRIENIATKTIDGIKKAGCKALYGIGCPLAVKTLGKALMSNGSSVEDKMVAFGVALGKKACHVRKTKCKRSVEMAEVLLPFSDEINDFDINRDKLITYEEFKLAVLTSVGLVEPEELREPFLFSDFDGNGVLDTDEFKGAPLLFAHIPYARRNVNLG